MQAYFRRGLFAGFDLLLGTLGDAGRGRQHQTDCYKLPGQNYRFSS